MRKLLFFSFLLFCIPFLGNAFQLNLPFFLEDFDGFNTTNPPSFIDSLCSGDKDYFDLVCQNGVGCANEISADFTLNGATGQYFGVRDFDAAPCSVTAPKSFSFADIDVSSCPDDIMYLCFFVAESRNVADSLGAEWSASNVREDTWDGSSSLIITASVDGASFTTVTAIEAFDNSDTRPGIDVNCNGKADGAGEPELTATFTQYCFELPASGALLDLNFEFNELNTQGEDIALDNISVYCQSFPTSGTLLPACTPYQAPSVSFFKEDFDGSNTTNLPTYSVPLCSDDKDYFDIVCQNGGGCANEISADFAIIGSLGQYFGIRDFDAAPCAQNIPKTIDFAGIDISSCTADILYMCIDVAESRNIGDSIGNEWGNTNMREDTWDSGSSFKIFASVDGASFTTVTAIEAFENSDTRPGFDVNCSGKANNAGEPELTDTFTKYCFELPGLGAVIDLQFEVSELNTGGEDLAFDNIELFCGGSNLPSTGIILGACTPFTAPVTSFFLEDFDGANTTNTPTYSELCGLDRDYFNIVCSANAGCPNEINDDFILGGVSGQYFGVRDFDALPCLSDTLKTIDIAAIDISSCMDNLYMCFDVAESRNIGDSLGAEWSDSNMREDTWDGNTSFQVSANIDGSGFTTITGIEAFDNSDTRPGIDVSCDGQANDAGEPELTDVFTKYCFQLPSSGLMLDLHFDFLHMNTGGEDLALDNIALFCGNTNLPFNGSLLAACGGSSCQNSLLVSGNITTATYEAIIDVQADGTIAANQVVDMNAGSFVELLTGFECDANADLHIFIEACQ